jgi:hypothetical protein
MRGHIAEDMPMKRTNKRFGAIQLVALLICFCVVSLGGNFQGSADGSNSSASLTVRLDETKLPEKAKEHLNRILKDGRLPKDSASEQDIARAKDLYQRALRILDERKREPMSQRALVKAGAPAVAQDTCATCENAASEVSEIAYELCLADGSPMDCNLVWAVSACMYMFTHCSPCSSVGTVCGLVY